MCINIFHPIVIHHASDTSRLIDSPSPDAALSLGHCNNEHRLS